jgi:hypothetical protein
VYVLVPIPFCNEVVSLSTTFMASSNASLVHLPLVFIGLHLLTLLYFLIYWFSIQKMVGHFFHLGLVSLPIHFASYNSTPLAPTSNTFGVCVLTLQEILTWIFCIFLSSQKSMKGQGMCEMHMSLVVGKKWSIHRTIQSHPKLSFGQQFLCKQ